MPGQYDAKHRRPIPRWRYAGQTTINGEHLGDPREKRPLATPAIAAEKALQRFTAAPSVATASELIHEAIASRSSDLAAPAVTFLRKKQRRRTLELDKTLDWLESGRRAAPTLIGPPSGPNRVVEDSRAVIRRTRKLVCRDPRSLLPWLDLARAYTILGQSRSAERSLRAAISLAPDHRIALRTYARWLVHDGRAEEAWHLIRRHARTKTDPWLMSLEISLASIIAEQPTSATKGIRLVEDLSHTPGFISELASAVGSLEMQAGSHRRSRKFFRVSLLDPTDNAVAQAQWASRKDSALQVEASILSRPTSIEARFWRAMHDQRWSEAMNEAEAWQADEPFSGRPAINGSFLATTLLNDPISGIRMADIGLRADASDQLLRNNLVVALIHGKEIERAQTEFQLIHPPFQDSYHEYVYHATKGLLLFAMGQYEQGRSAYSIALGKVSTPAEKARVLLHYFEAESLADPATATTLFPSLARFWDDEKSPSISALKARILDSHRERERTARQPVGVQVKIDNQILNFVIPR